MSKLKIFLAAIAAVAVATPAMAATFEFHGDFDNRFGLYTNQAGMYSSVENVKNTWVAAAADPDVTAAIDENDVEEFFADIKYRMNTTAATNDGNVKGVFAVEIGGVQYGTSPAGDFSGDGTVVEVRKAYTDFQLPGMQNKARVSIGLQPVTINKFLWWEMATGVQFKSSNFTLGWARGNEVYNTAESDDLFQDLDSVFARFDLNTAETTKLGLFALYQRMDNLAAGDDSMSGINAYQIKRFNDSEFGIYTLGVDGGFTTPTSYGNGFVNWDLMYQGGEVSNNTVEDDDVSAFFAHADVGVNLGPTRFTYTGWYSSGDDDPNDGDRENFMTTDNDRADSIIFFEGGYTNDDYFTETQYLLDKGLILNKLAVDHKMSEQTTIGGAVIYLMTAEDLALADGSEENTLGTELDAYISHKLYENVEVALNFGYLVADDGMDFWEVQADGESDADIYRGSARVRYKF